MGTTRSSEKSNLINEISTDTVENKVEISEYKSVSERESECEEEASENEFEIDNAPGVLDCHFATVRMASLNAEDQSLLDENLTGPLLRGIIKAHSDGSIIEGLSLWDSGASSSLVALSAVRRGGALRSIRKRSDQKVSDLTGVLGGIGTVQGEIDVIIQIDGISFEKHAMLVVDLGKDDYTFYIGSDFLSKHGVIVDMRALEVRYTPKDKKVDYTIDFNWETLQVDKFPGEFFSEEEDDGNFDFGLSNLNFTERNDLKLAESKLITDVSSLKEQIQSSNHTYPEWTREGLASKIKIGDQLTDLQRDKVIDMLFENREVFSKGPLDINLSLLGEYRIKLNNPEPVYDKPRFINPATNKLVMKEIEDLLALGIIEPAVSPYNSRIVPVKKVDDRGNTSIRLCIDYRNLNKCVVPDRYPMKSVQDSIFHLGKCEYFTGLDLVKGYFQIGLHPESRPYTAFTVGGKHFQFRRLSQGLASSPGAFQRQMIKLIDCIEEISVEERQCITAFLDDILGKGNDFDTHLNTIDKLLKTMIKFKLKIKPSKCQFFVEKIKFLGYLCSKEGIEKAPEFFEEIEHYQRPKNVKELRSFLGVLGFYRNHVKGFSTIVEPLNAWLGREDKTPIEWDRKLENSFVTIKQAALLDIKLAFPVYGDENRKLILTVDGSAVAAGYYLSQEDENGVERVIAYGSNSFNKSQRQYSATEKELASLRMGVKAFREFLGQDEFRIRTDHGALVYLMNMSVCNARLARTLVDLGEYNFTIEHIKGTLNECADGLSRLPRHYAAAELDREEEVTRIDPEGLTVVFKPEGGADSLYACLLSAFERNMVENKDNVKSIKQLRLILVEELLKNAPVFGIELTKERKATINRCALEGFQPLMEMLEAFSKRYGTQVYLHFGTKFPIVFAYDRNEKKKIHLQYKDNIHFNLFDKVADTDFSVKLIECNHRPQSCTVRMNLGGTNMCVLLDTGSSISLINEKTYKIFKENGMVVREGTTNFILDAFASRVYKKDQLVIEARCIFGKETVVNKFIVLSGEFMNHCAILGTNLLLQTEWLINFDSRSVTTGHGDLVCMFENAPKPQRVNANYNRQENTVTVKYIGQISEAIPSYHSNRNDTISKIQETDFILSAVRKSVLNGTQLPGHCIRFKRVLSSLKVVNGRLMNVKYDSIVVPFHFAIGYCTEVHFENCHVGKMKLLELVGRDIFHPSLSKICEDICTSCDSCQRSKHSGVKAKAPLTRVQTSYPGELVSVDLLSLPANRENFVGMFVAVDLYTKYGMVAPIKSKTGVHIAETFENKIMPAFVFKINCICSDRGREFISAAFNEVLDRYGMEHIFCASAYPQGNGSAERFNRTILQLLNLETTDMSFWPRHITKILQVYNGTVHSQLKCSPRDFILQNSHNASNNSLQTPRVRAYWSKGNANFTPFSVGNKVLKQIKYIGDLNKYKLMPKYCGPWTVTKIYPNLLTYDLVNEEGQTMCTHYNFLRLYRDPPKYLIDHETYRAYIEEDMTEEACATPSPSPKTFQFRFTFPSGESSETGESQMNDRLSQSHKNSKIKEQVSNSCERNSEVQNSIIRSSDRADYSEKRVQILLESSYENESEKEPEVENALQPEQFGAKLDLSVDPDEPSDVETDDSESIGSGEPGEEVRSQNAEALEGRAEENSELDLNMCTVHDDTRDMAPRRALRSRGGVGEVELPRVALEYKSRKKSSK